MLPPRGTFASSRRSMIVSTSRATSAGTDGTRSVPKPAPVSANPVPAGIGSEPGPKKSSGISTGSSKKVQLRPPRALPKLCSISVPLFTTHSAGPQQTSVDSVIERHMLPSIPLHGVVRSGSHGPCAIGFRSPKVCRQIAESMSRGRQQIPCSPGFRHIPTPKTPQGSPSGSKHSPPSMGFASPNSSKQVEPFASVGNGASNTRQRSATQQASCVVRPETRRTFTSVRRRRRMFRLREAALSLAIVESVVLGCAGRSCTHTRFSGGLTRQLRARARA